ncbi:SDR family oxidoreductase [Ectopseudomonas mendocina]|uniref:SDR family oxidoreductase n=1 Tax=Ectopseudomonas mendocina TaxID=300 RepID=UPI00373FC818
MWNSISIPQRRRYGPLRCAGGKPWQCHLHLFDLRHRGARVPSGIRCSQSRSGKLRAQTRRVHLASTVYASTVLRQATSCSMAPFGSASSGSNRDAVESMLQRDVALARLGSPKDVARLAAYLASPLGGFITGATYVVDGGQLRS